jgi:hypothetical protein
MVAKMSSPSISQATSRARDLVGFVCQGPQLEARTAEKNWNDGGIWAWTAWTPA